MELRFRQQPGDEVERMLATADHGDIPQRRHLLILLGKHEEADELLMPYERSGNLQALAGYLTYRQFDPSPFPSLMRVLERVNVQRPPAEPLPFACKRSVADS